MFNRMVEWRFLSILSVAGGIALSGCGPGSQMSEDLATTDQALTAGPDPLVEPDLTQAAAGSVLLVGTILDGTGVPVPGVTIGLSGAASHSAITSSNGVYNFANLPTGTYTIRPTNGNAVFSPSSVTFTTTKSIDKSFTCKSGCDGVASVDPLREIMVVDPSVVNDARASNATDGPWSFRFLMEQMTPDGVSPSEFVRLFFQGFRSSAGPINGFPVEERPFLDSALLQDKNLWPHIGTGDTLDLSKAPFQLMAIVNRTDLHVVGAGEARFVFGLFSSPAKGGANGLPMTLIFEYRLPTTKAATGAPILRNDWIKQFHALGSLPSFGSAYNDQLQAITDQFTRKGTNPAKPNGSSISQVRSNEIQLGGIWQMREFHLVNDSTGKGFLKLSPAAQTPDDSLNGSSSVASYILNNELTIRTGLATVPNSLIGGQSDENPRAAWAFPTLPPSAEAARHKFAGQTCDGCHSIETTQNIDLFYQVTPRLDAGPLGTANVADFILSTEFPRRKRFMQNRLICSSGRDCSPGAEPME